MTFDPHTTPPSTGLGRTRQWRAIEQSSPARRQRDSGISSLLALAILTALVLAALFALPI